MASDRMRSNDFENLAKSYGCKKLLGSGQDAVAWVSPQNSNVVILFDTSSEIKKIAYLACGMLYKHESETIDTGYYKIQVNIYHVKRLKNRRNSRAINAKVKWFDKMVDLSWENEKNRDNREMTVNGWCFWGDLYTLVDIATDPRTPQYLAKFFLAIIDYAISTQQHIWFDNFWGNWLQDTDSHRCYPLDLFNCI